MKKLNRICPMLKPKDNDGRHVFDEAIRFIAEGLETGNLHLGHHRLVKSESLVDFLVPANHITKGRIKFSNSSILCELSKRYGSHRNLKLTCSDITTKSLDSPLRQPRASKDTTLL